MHASMTKLPLTKFPLTSCRTCRVLEDGTFGRNYIPYLEWQHWNMNHQNLPIKSNIYCWENVWKIFTYETDLLKQKWSTLRPKMATQFNVPYSSTRPNRQSPSVRRFKSPTREKDTRVWVWDNVKWVRQRARARESSKRRAKKNQRLWFVAVSCHAPSLLLPSPSLPPR